MSGVFLVMGRENRTEKTDTELAHYQPQNMSDSEGDTDLDSMVKDQPPQSIYKTKTGVIKERLANKAILTHVPGKGLQTFILWHRKLAHASPQVVGKFQQKNYPQVPLPLMEAFPFCDLCTHTEMTKKTIDKVQTQPVV